MILGRDWRRSRRRRTRCSLSCSNIGHLSPSSHSIMRRPFIFEQLHDSSRCPSPFPPQTNIRKIFTFTQEIAPAPAQEQLPTCLKMRSANFLRRLFLSRSRRVLRITGRFFRAEGARGGGCGCGKRTIKYMVVEKLKARTRMTRIKWSMADARLAVAEVAPRAARLNECSRRREERIGSQGSSTTSSRKSPTSANRARHRPPE